MKKRPLVKKLDKIFSLYIRSKYAVDGMVECYTCGVVKPVKEMQCGHFISRTYYILRWDERNTRPQCVSCNMYHAGQQYIFGKKLEKDLGAEVVDELHRLKSQPAKLSILTYEAMIEKYRGLHEDIENND